MTTKGADMLNASKKINVLVVDNQPTTLSGMRVLFSKTNDINLIGELSSGYDLYHSRLTFKASIILLDIAVSGSDPADLIHWIHDNRPNACVLIFTHLNDMKSLTKMMDVGACGYLSKEEPESNLVNAIRKVANGEIVFSQQQHKQIKDWKEKVFNKIAQLTHQELETLKLLAKGWTNQQIALALDISTNTAAFHVTNVMKKLGVSSRMEAAVWAITNMSDNLE
ncbi:MAG: response regulator transcription factor [Anaerolineales bacterium]|nr:response regulator transcription factor [Anaerolineales bacterium]